MPTDRSHRAEFGVLVASGLGLLAGAPLRWVREGSGSRLGGLALADALREGALVPDRGRWVALAIYSVVACGGLVIASAAARSRTVATARLVVATVIAVGLAIGATAGFPPSRWSVAPVLVLGATAAAAVVSVLQLRVRRD